MTRYRLTLMPALVVAIGMVACGHAAPPVSPASPPPSSSVSSQQVAELVTIPISYTDDYLLFEGDELGFTTVDDRTRKLGLMTKDGKEILPAAYTEISISEEGIIFVSVIEDPNKPTIYRIFDLDGKQIGKDYSFIESVSPGSDGMYVYRQASFTGMAAIPPYAAHTEDASGKRSYWLLDAKGIPTEERPYDDIAIYDDSICTVRDGYCYTTPRDGGETTILGNEVVESYFDGKYQVMSVFKSTGRPRLGLWDKSGNILIPPKHTRIHVPFEDRFIVGDGSPEFTGGMRYAIYDNNCKLIADNSNDFFFQVESDGRYVGLSYVGNPYQDYVEEQIVDANGNPEPQGIYFVDKNGVWLSEGYKFVEKYANEQDLQDNGGDGRIISHSKIDGYSKPLPEGDYSKPFYLCLTQQDKLVYRAYSDMLLAQ